MSRPVPEELIEVIAAAPIVSPWEIKMWDACGGYIRYSRTRNRWGGERGPIVHYPDLTLNEREVAVLVRLSQGLYAKEIASELGLPYDAVGRALRRIRFKLRSSSNEQAVGIAVARGLVPGPILSRSAKIVAGISGLTLRQRQVLKHVADGLTNIQIGDELGISDQTVKRHMENLFARYGARSRAHLVALAMRHGQLI
jgi:DNA-binding CsgD family transcriptional regulator